MLSVRFYMVGLLAVILSVIPAYSMQQQCTCNCLISFGTRVRPVQQTPATAAPSPQQMPEDSPRTVSYNPIEPQATLAPLTIVITRPGEEEQQDPSTIINSPTDMPGSVPA